MDGLKTDATINAPTENESRVSNIQVKWHSLMKGLLAPDITWRTQVIRDATYLQRDRLLVQRTNQMLVNMRPLLMQKTLFPVLPNMIHTHTHSKYIMSTRDIWLLLSECVQLRYSFIRHAEHMWTRRKNWFLSPFPWASINFWQFGTHQPLVGCCLISKSASPVPNTAHVTQLSTCLPVEDESDGCHHDDADAQNDHDHVLDV